MAAEVVRRGTIPQSAAADAARQTWEVVVWRYEWALTPTAAELKAACDEVRLASSGALVADSAHSALRAAGCCIDFQGLLSIAEPLRLNLPLSLPLDPPPPTPQIEASWFLRTHPPLLALQRAFEAEFRAGKYGKVKYYQMSEYVSR